METITQGLIEQGGAFAICAALLAILLWLVRWILTRLLAVIERNTTALEKLTGAVEDQGASTQALAAIASANERRLLARPCIARHEEGGG